MSIFNSTESATTRPYKSSLDVRALGLENSSIF